jgi:hypothetical protein
MDMNTIKIYLLLYGTIICGGQSVTGYCGKYLVLSEILWKIFGSK